MSLNFEASKDFQESITDIDTLLQFAIKEGEDKNWKNRNLFLKLAVVSVVTKFQVFVENLLNEYKDELKKSNKKYSEMPIHFRLNSIRMFISCGKSEDTLEDLTTYINDKLEKKLKDPTAYTDDKLKEIKNKIEKILDFCKDDKIIDENIQFETKFPLGKTGTAELKKLFYQINGENIFEISLLDKLNEILERRHAIVHQDKDQNITEETLREYKKYLLDMVEYLDAYLQKYL